MDFNPRIYGVLLFLPKNVQPETEKVKTNLSNKITMLKTQIEDANKEIQSYKDMDI